MAGTAAMAVGHVLMFLNYTCQWRTSLTVAAMLVPTGAFTLSLAPLSWVVVSEIYPNRIRGKGMSIATCAMFAASFGVAKWFPVVCEKFKTAFGHPGGAFLIFTGICLACSLFVWLTLPETKDKTLEEIGEGCWPPRWDSTGGKLARGRRRIEVRGVSGRGGGQERLSAGGLPAAPAVDGNAAGGGGAAGGPLAGNFRSGGFPAASALAGGRAQIVSTPVR